MAKSKKSKKSKANYLSYVKYGAIALGLLGLIMTVLTFYNCGDAGSFSGIQTIFGYSKEGLKAAVPILQFSFLALLAVLLPVVGCFGVLFKNKIVKLVGALLMLAGCVLCFIIPSLVVVEKTAFIYANGSLGVGAVLAGIFFGLGALCSVYPLVKE